jgi:hypothetical protein
MSDQNEVSRRTGEGPNGRFRALTGSGGGFVARQIDGQCHMSEALQGRA